MTSTTVLEVLQISALVSCHQAQEEQKHTSEYHPGKIFANFNINLTDLIIQSVHANGIIIK